MTNKKKRRFLVGSPQKAGSMAYEKTTDTKFVELVKARQYGEALKIIGEVKDINTRDEESKGTALHWASARAATNFIEELSNQRSDIDYLATDSNGNRPSEVAWHTARNEPLAAWLMKKEKEQAATQHHAPWPTLGQ
jgi:hypothetical protein